MEPSEFVTFAGRTVIHGKAGARSAISRAYYGVFHAARELLDELVGDIAKSGRSHNLVSQFLFESRHPTASSAARILATLHSDRIEADYDLLEQRPENVGFARSKVELATDVLSLISQYRDDCLADPQVLQTLRDAVARVKSIHKA